MLTPSLMNFSRILSGNLASLFRLINYLSPPRESGKYFHDFIHASHGATSSSNCCRDVAVRCTGPVSSLHFANALLDLA